METVTHQALCQVLYIGCCCSVAKSYLTLCDPMDCSLSGSSVHGVVQARILEWVAICYSITIRVV